MVQLTGEQLANRQNATTTYLNTNPDLLNAARAYATSLGIPQSNVGGFASAMSNYAVGHYLTKGKDEDRGGTAGLESSGTELNTNLAIVPQLTYGVDATTGNRVYNPVEGTFDASTPNLNVTGGDDTTGDTGDTGGDDTTGDTGDTGDTGGEDTTDLASVIADLPSTIASAVANALPEQPSSSPTSLMSPTAVGTATPAPDLSPVTEDIGDVQADTTAIRGDIGTRAEGQPATLMGQTAGLAQGQTDITGRIGTAPTTDATLFSGQEGLAQGIVTAQQGITGVQAGIGEAPVDPTTGDPTTLFQGQAGLMAGQTGLTGAISGVGNQASAIGSDLTALTNQLTNFENLSNADRANLLSTLNTRATELKDLANTYGLQTNRIAEQLTGVPAPTGMMAQAAPVAGSLPAVLAAERAQNTATQNINRGLMDVAEQGQVGALGPVTPDPRVG